MFNVDLITSARWGDLYGFFTAGYPPLIVKLLVINTIFLVLFVFRQARAKHRMRSTTAYMVQALLIIANGVVMFQTDFGGFGRMISAYV
jgi:hypothetical protein